MHHIVSVCCLENLKKNTNNLGILNFAFNFSNFISNLELLGKFFELQIKDALKFHNCKNLIPS